VSNFVFDIKGAAYEEESVSRSQMDIKRKATDIGTWTKHLFLVKSSNNIDTLVPPPCYYIKTCSIEVLWGSAPR
jgi:hypothetical protein